MIQNEPLSSQVLVGEMKIKRPARIIQEDVDGRDKWDKRDKKRPEGCRGSPIKERNDDPNLQGQGLGPKIQLNF